MQFSGEPGVFIVATTVENGDRDTISDEGSDDGVVAALHIFCRQHHFTKEI